jgi:hypothetical protein
MPKNKPKDTAEDATPAPKKRNKKRHAGPSALVTNSMGTSAKATAQNNKKRRKSATVKGLDQSSLYNEVAAGSHAVLLWELNSKKAWRYSAHTHYNPTKYYLSQAKGNKVT